MPWSCCQFAVLMVTLKLELICLALSGSSGLARRLVSDWRSSRVELESLLSGAAMSKAALSSEEEWISGCETTCSVWQLWLYQQNHPEVPSSDRAVCPRPCCSPQAWPSSTPTAACSRAECLFGPAQRRLNQLMLRSTTSTTHYRSSEITTSLRLNQKVNNYKIIQLSVIINLVVKFLKFTR